MDFFGMGAGEILLVIIVALIIWGPGKIPEIARTAGKALNTLRQTGSDLTTQITKELEEAEEGKRDHSPHPEVNISPKTPSILPPTASKSENTGED